MKKSDFFIGFFIGILATAIGMLIFLFLFTNFSQTFSLSLLVEQDLLGKIITLGTILNVISFFVLMRFKKDFMARGVLFSTILLALITIFI